MCIRDRHNLPIDYKVTNENDSKAMGTMLRRTKSILRTTDFTGLYDKGYHTGTEIKTDVYKRQILQTVTTKKRR